MNAMTSNLSRLSAAFLLSIVLLVLTGGARVAQAQQFLPADQAFSVDVVGAGPSQLDVRLTVAKGTYLYRERLVAQLTSAQGGNPVMLDWAVPPGEIKHDPNFDKDVEVYHHDVAAKLTIPAGVAGVQRLKLGYQGCADAGICYPPQNKLFDVQLGAKGEVLDVTPVVATAGGRASSAVPQAQGRSSAASADPDRVSAALASGRLALIVPVFLLAGVLLSLTPCVLPMVPILSSIIVGHGTQVSRGRGFLLALEQRGVLDADARERVIERALALEQSPVDLHDLKWVVLLVLYNTPDREAGYAWMESQLLGAHMARN